MRPGASLGRLSRVAEKVLRRSNSVRSLESLGRGTARSAGRESRIPSIHEPLLVRQAARTSDSVPGTTQQTATDAGPPFGAPGDARCGQAFLAEKEGRQKWRIRTYQQGSGRSALALVWRCSRGWR